MEKGRSLRKRFEKKIAEAKPQSSFLALTAIWSEALTYQLCPLTARFISRSLTKLAGNSSAKCSSIEHITILETLVPWALRENSGRVNMAPYGVWMPFMDAVRPAVPLSTARSRPVVSRQEVRCAVRFPLALPVVLSSGQGEIAAITRDVSASGVVFELDSPVQTGLEIRFSLRMPSAILGTPHDVLVHCQGRVVRCQKNQSNYQAAATIDDYQFAEQ